jgi:hypothetical protein
VHPFLSLCRRQVYPERLIGNPRSIQSWAFHWFCRHHHNGRWEARIGRVLGNKYLYLGTFGMSPTVSSLSHFFDGLEYIPIMWVSMGYPEDSHLVSLLASIESFIFWTIYRGNINIFCFW